MHLPLHTLPSAGPLALPSILLFASVAPLLLFRRRLLRRIPSTYPFCARCHYNLTGLSSPACPECGQDLRTPHAISTTRPAATRLLLALFLATTLASVLFLTHRTRVYVRTLDPIPWKFTSTLFRDLQKPHPMTPHPAVVELIKRSAAGQLSPDENDRLANQLFTLDVKLRPVVTRGHRLPYELRIREALLNDKFPRSDRACGISVSATFYVLTVDHDHFVPPDDTRIDYEYSESEGNGGTSSVWMDEEAAIVLFGEGIKPLSDGDHQIDVVFDVEVKVNVSDVPEVVLRTRRGFTSSITILPTGVPSSTFTSRPEHRSLMHSIRAEHTAFGLFLWSAQLPSAINARVFLRTEGMEHDLGVVLRAPSPLPQWGGRLPNRIGPDASVVLRPVPPDPQKVVETQFWNEPIVIPLSAPGTTAASISEEPP